MSVTQDMRGAELAALVREGEVVAAAGFGPAGPPAAVLAAAARGGDQRLSLPAFGQVTLTVARVRANPPTTLVVGRRGGESFTPEERALVSAIAPIVAATATGAEADRVAERTLYRSEGRLRGILDASDAAFVSTDADGLILDWNARAEAMFGWRRAEALGCSLSDKLAVGEEPVSFSALFAGNGASADTDRVELTVRHRDGHQLPVEVTVSRLPAGGTSIYHAFIYDIADRQQAEQERRDAQERLAHLSLHDSLTGLPNRTLLVEHLSHALALGRRSGSATAVLFADVDNLRVINDGLGHRAGDEVLVAIARRLRDVLRASDTISRLGEAGLARLGGDEFAVICENVSDEHGAVAAAERMAEALRSPFEIAGERVSVTLSIGIALSTPEASAESVLRDAGAAMHDAKEGGRARHRLFDDDMRERVLGRLTRADELQRAIEHDELRLHYQPIVSVADGGLVGVEALVRWEHPERGLLAPAEFVPFAEETGMIVPIGRWVMREACAQASAWHRRHGPAAPLRVTVNVSGRQLAEGEAVRVITDLLEEACLEPSRLALEITETVLMAELDAPVDALRELQALGVRILLDDFGTGYSSLSYLRRLPLDGVKLDRSFISQLDETMADRQIVAAVVQLARALQMSVVAEGVESEEQLNCLRELGCHFAQGFYLARPMPAEEITSLLESRNGGALAVGATT